MRPDILLGSSQQQKKKRQDSTGAIFPAPGIISLAGQQNPTRGTTAFLDAIRWADNLHKVNALRRVGTFGTAVARRFRVSDSTSRPCCIQIPLLLL
ncbi:MAG: hypothetical protein DME32_02300 [Verrucomicrobia bacterium]|nr:MAG: hypothetical protein DME32_02300 [Verrucomicrobiota bacterium]